MLQNPSPEWFKIERLWGVAILHTGERGQPAPAPAARGRNSTRNARGSGSTLCRRRAEMTATDCIRLL
eukprot:3970561-Lingulodinium_polyedra.AAC.1